ncbi:polyphosphate polymerase domain-containing protein [Viscerimonas tarda]
MNIPINDILKQIAPITLDEMKHIRLMDRVDSKFVAPVHLLPDLLENLILDFKLQTIVGKPFAAYTTQYLDTPDLRFFLMHQNGKLNRQKIRIRSYVDSNLSFLEIKNKNNKGRTQKIRVPVEQTHIETVEDLADEQDFLHTHALFDLENLEPVLANTFNRITLVNNRATERITIDWDLNFQNLLTGIEDSPEKLMVLELKQDGRTASDFHDILNRLHVKPSAFSKYCMGTVLTNPNVKYNRFKSKWTQINKLIN